MRDSWLSGLIVSKQRIIKGMPSSWAGLDLRNLIVNSLCSGSSSVVVGWELKTGRRLPQVEDGYSRHGEKW